MTSTEIRFIRRLIIFLVIAALCPLGAFAYRVALSVAPEAIPAPDPLFTLVPGSADGAFITPTPTTYIVVLPNGWSEHALADEGFAISVPTTWQTLPVKPEELAAALTSVRQSNPELADALGANAVSLMQNGVKFWAFALDDQPVQSEFATNITVTHQLLPNSVSFETFVAVNRNQLNALTSRSGEIENEQTMLSGLPAERLRYNLKFDSGAAPFTAAITQYLVLNGSHAYVVTFATRADRVEQYKGVFDQSAQSLRLFGK